MIASDAFVPGYICEDALFKCPNTPGVTLLRSVCLCSLCFLGLTSVAFSRVTVPCRQNFDFDWGDGINYSHNVVARLEDSLPPQGGGTGSELKDTIK